MKPKSKRTVVALGNAIELATGVVHEVAGHEVAKTLNGSRATRSALADHVASRINAKLIHKHSNARKGTK